MSLDGLCCRELHECYPVICEQLDIPAEGGSVKETRRIRHWRDRLPPLVFPNFQQGGYGTSLNPFKHENAYGFYRDSIYIDDEWELVEPPNSYRYYNFRHLESHCLYRAMRGYGFGVLTYGLCLSCYSAGLPGASCPTCGGCDKTFVVMLWNARALAQICDQPIVPIKKWKRSHFKKEQLWKQCQDY